VYLVARSVGEVVAVPLLGAPKGFRRETGQCSGGEGGRRADVRGDP